ncbi:MAG: hypothetical protein ABUL42_00355 [Terricaulis silvestris]
MTFEVQTLAQFFNYGDQAQNAVQTLTKSPELNASTLTHIARAATAHSLVDAGRQLLNTPLTDFLADAWTTRQDLKRFADPNAYPPNQINEYPLVAHEIAVKRTPSVEVLLNGAPAGLKFDFELKLALEIKSAILKIQAGRIVGARVSDFLGSGSFSCADVTLAERKTATFRLPGAANFSPGVAIP